MANNLIAGGGFALMAWRLAQMRAMRSPSSQRQSMARKHYAMMLIKAEICWAVRDETFTTTAYL